jgi:hypothetical protein
MKKNYFDLQSLVIALVSFLIWSVPAKAQFTVVTFSYTGAAQDFTVPPCVTQLTLEVWGAEGGGSNISLNTASGYGGYGGYAAGVLTVAPSSTLSVYVGGFGQSSNTGLAAGGWNGGGSGYASSSAEPGNGGGGASDIRLNGQTMLDRVIVAGGGGGGGEDAGDAYGHGGGLTGVNYPAYDATQTAPGAGGGLGFGATTGFGDGGGGGGGYYGGGTFSSTTIGDDTQGGGGGSGYVGTLTSTVLIAGNLSMPNPAGGTMTGRSGNGYARITYSMNGTAATISPNFAPICNGNSATLNGSGVVTYTWLPVGAFTGSNSANITVNPTSTTSYTLQGTNSLGCVSQMVATVNVATAPPVMTINTSTTSLCLGKTATLTATGALTYTWVNPGVVNGQPFIPQATTAYSVQGQNGCGITVATTTITVSPLPVTASASSTLVCEGYTSTLTAVSSAPSYSWLPGAMTGSTNVVAPMATTMYTVTAYDGTCSGTATVNIQTKTTPTITASASATNICQGASVTVSAGGAGTGGTYSWTPGGSGSSITLSPATSSLFNVVGTNSLNCSASAQQAVVVSLPPNVSISASQTLVCSGNAAQLFASGAATYSWVGGPATAGNTVTPAGAGSVYTVLGFHTTNTCVATKTVAISALVPNVNVPASHTVCNGGTATLTATGATSYTWNGVSVGGSGVLPVSPTVTTTYPLVALTSSLALNCISNHTSMVTVYALPSLTVTPAKTTICKGETHTLTATGAVTYSWSVAGSGSVITVKPSSSTFYSVTGIDGNGCESTLTFQAAVSNCNAITEINGAHALSVYPNPSTGEFVVRSDSDISLKIVNGIGQEVRTMDLNSNNNFRFQVKDLSAGVYFIVGENENGQVNQKIVISK